MSKVSVILPAYNCLPFIKQSVESILNQTFTDFELIIVEDGSKDKIRDYLFSLTDPRIKLIVHIKNQGLVTSLNDALRLSTSEYIAVQHGDDVSVLNRLQKQISYLDTHPDIHFVSTCAKFINEHDVMNPKDSWWLKQIKRAPEDPRAVADKLLEMNFLVHTSVMFKRCVLDVGVYDAEMVPAEDYDLFLRISDKYNIAIMKEVLVYYREHSNQISKTTTSTGESLMQLKAKEAIRRTKIRRGK